MPNKHRIEDAIAILESALYGTFLDEFNHDDDGLFAESARNGNPETLSRKVHEVAGALDLLTKGKKSENN